MRLNETARTLFSLYVPSALVSFAQGALVPITPALAEAFDVPLGLAAQVFSANLLGRLILMIPSGVLVDRYGARSAMLAGPVIIVLCSAVTLVTPNFWLLLVAQFLAGGGSGLWQLGRELIAVDLVKMEARGRVMSVFIGVSTAGIAVGPFVGGLINDSIGFRGVFGLALAMSIFVLAISFTVADAGKKHEHSASHPAWSLGGIGEIDPYYRATYLALIFCTLAATLRQTVSTAMLPLYAGSELGYSATEVGGLFGIMGFTSLAVLGLAGWVSDTLGRKAAVVPAAVVSGLCFLAFPFTTDYLGLSIISVVMGVASSFAMGSMTVYTYDIVPPQARGRLQSLRRVIGETSGTLGPMVGGVMASVSSPGTVFLLFAPFHLASALLVGLVAKESIKRVKPAAETQ